MGYRNTFLKGGIKKRALYVFCVWAIIVSLKNREGFWPWPITWLSQIQQYYKLVSHQEAKYFLCEWHYMQVPIPFTHATSYRICWLWVVINHSKLLNQFSQKWISIDLWASWFALEWNWKLALLYVTSSYATFKLSIKA